jgi:hypothetical protein
MLKFTLKHLLHVLVQSESSGSALFELAKVQAQIMRSLMMVIAPKHVGALLMFF